MAVNAMIVAQKFLESVMKGNRNQGYSFLFFDGRKKACIYISMNSQNEFTLKAHDYLKEDVGMYEAFDCLSNWLENPTGLVPYNKEMK